MKLKGRGILVLALLFLGGFAVYDYFQDQKKEQKATEESRLLTLNFEQIDNFEIQKGAKKIAVKRSVNGWELTEPIQDLADNQAVDDFIKNLVPEKIIDVAREGTDVDWSLYGLDKPQGQVTLKTTMGESNVFTISERKNFEQNAFARRNQEARVLVVNSSWQSRVDKDVMDFRDRRVLRHKIASVDVISLKNEKGLLELQRVDGKWKGSSKKEFKLDQNKVRDLLTTIADARVDEFFENNSATIPKLKELFRLNLMMDKKVWTAKVGQASNLPIYATLSDPSWSVKLAPGAMDKLIKLTYEDLQEAPAEEAKKNDNSKKESK